LGEKKPERQHCLLLVLLASGGISDNGQDGDKREGKGATAEF